MISIGVMLIAPVGGTAGVPLQATTVGDRTGSLAVLLLFLFVDHISRSNRDVLIGGLAAAPISLAVSWPRGGGVRRPGCW